MCDLKIEGDIYTVAAAFFSCCCWCRERLFFTEIDVFVTVLKKSRVPDENIGGRRLSGLYRVR